MLPSITAAPINIPMNSKDRNTERVELRKALTNEIVADVEYEINDVLAWAPDSLTEKDRKSIRDEVIAQTRHVTDALTLAELQNEGARRAYTCGALATVRQMINLRVAQGKKRDGPGGYMSVSVLQPAEVASLCRRSRCA